VKLEIRNLVIDPMKDKLILIGGGGHCKSCIDVIEQEGRFEIAGILDVPEKIGTEVLGYPVIGSDDMIHELVKEYSHFFITVGQIGSPEIRVNIFDKLKQLGLELPVIISPNAYVSRHAILGEGTIVMHHALTNAGATVGLNCIINSKALVEHDAQIEDHCHIATGAIINGGVIVGKRSFVGSGVITKQYVTIPANSFIKAQSLIK
jgi:sugar O-acyltransferase (sialic acid O-acetyltransferase NeuD family)